ncbi:MAG: hypothetical protein AB1894_12810 [Chloroflexota bacterium]
MKISRRTLIPLGVFLLFWLIYGLLAGFDTAGRCGLFFFAALLPLLGGGVLIYRYAWYRRQWLAILLAALLLGFVAFEVSLIGVLINRAPGSMDWSQGVRDSGLVGLIAFGVGIFMLPVTLAIARFLRSA